jgi:uncharacterized protein (DUF2235 family)
MAGEKRIVICCDGTGNSFDTLSEESNVAKLYSSLVLSESQIAYYHPGVGTMGAPNASTWIGREWSRFKGLAFGSGLLENVGDAYRFLMDTFADGDQIFLFGFSRGAFTVRVLASLIHVFGLLCAGNHQLIPYILNMYAKRSKEANHKRRTFETDEAFKWQFSHQNAVDIHFCGVWDTVSSYGWIYDPIELPFLGCNPIIRAARHAVSIDERRCYYQDNLWGESQSHQDIRQVWFSGVHSDVGGSYAENESGLSKVALEWMFVEARKFGLEFDQYRAEALLGRDMPLPQVLGLPDFRMPNVKDRIHNSLHGTWWLLELLPHQDPHLNAKGFYIPLGRRRQIPDNSLIHESVLQRADRSSNLPAMWRKEPWAPFE